MWTEFSVETFQANEMGPMGKPELVKVGEVAESILSRLGIDMKEDRNVRRAPVPSALYQV